MASVVFLYRSTKDSAFLTARLLFRIDKKDFILASKTKLEVTKTYWNKKHATKSKDISIINRQTQIKNELNKITQFVLKEFNKSSAPDQLNNKWLTSKIDNYYKPTKDPKNIPKDIVRFIDYYIELRKSEVKPASLKKFNVIKHKLQRLEGASGKTIYISEINEDFKQVFYNYCKEENYSQNTIQRELNIIKTFCKFARSKGIEVDSELDSLKLPKEKIDNIYLSLEEIELIENAEIEQPHLINATQWLIISCFTGQRISDFMRFTKEMIRIEKGKSLIEFEQQKTGKLMTIPIHAKVQQILGKNKGEFPNRISDQRYNDYIKEVCKIAGIDEEIQGKKQLNISKENDIQKIRRVEGVYPKYELVTSHIGRRSFATNYYGDIPTSYLIYVTGHSSEVMFLNYIGKSNKDMALELTKYF
jgi:integrase